MAAFSLTGVKSKVINSIFKVDAAEAITAGQAVNILGYIIDPTDSGKLAIKGVAVQDAPSGGDIVVALENDVITVTNTLTVHRTLICKPSGQVDYEDQLATGETHIIFGFTEDANTIRLRPYNSGKEMA